MKNILFIESSNVPVQTVHECSGEKTRVFFTIKFRKIRLLEEGRSIYIQDDRTFCIKNMGINNAYFEHHICFVQFNFSERGVMYFRPTYDEWALFRRLRIREWVQQPPEVSKYESGFEELSLELKKKQKDC